MELRGLSSGKGGNNSKRPISTETVDLEIPAIRGEDEVRSQLLGQHDERGVGVVHREILVLLNESVATSDRGQTGRDQRGASSEKKLQTRLTTTRNTSQQVCGLRQDRFGADHRPVPAGKKLCKPPVMDLPAIEEGNQRPCVEQ